MKSFNCFLLLSFSALAVAEQVQLRGATMEQDVIADDTLKSVDVVVHDLGYNAKSRRRFVRYESSHWEQLWLDFSDEWETKREICGILLHHQSELVHDFLNATCTSRYLPPYENWCVIDDEYRPLFYNTANRDSFDLTWEAPYPRAKIGKPQPIVPTEDMEHIFSKFTFLDEYTGEEYVEYIEPLVSHLRFPLCHCIDPNPNTPAYKYHYTSFRGWLVPPPPRTIKNYGQALYFDAGASSWSDGSGGPSLKYFYNVWQRSGIEFDDIYAFEMTTSPDAFYESIPFYHRGYVHYQQCAVSSKPEDDSAENPFLPNMIKRTATQDDYVLFKLDIDSPSVENGNIDFVLSDENNIIDELIWEHHISGNYLMVEWGPPEHQDQVSLRGSYEFFFKLRQKGIRAHSWV